MRFLQSAYWHNSLVFEHRSSPYLTFWRKIWKSQTKAAVRFRNIGADLHIQFFEKTENAPQELQSHTSAECKERKTLTKGVFLRQKRTKNHVRKIL